MYKFGRDFIQSKFNSASDNYCTDTLSHLSLNDMQQLEKRTKSIVKVLIAAVAVLTAFGTIVTINKDIGPLPLSIVTLLIIVVVCGYYYFFENADTKASNDFGSDEFMMEFITDFLSSQDKSMFTDKIHKISKIERSIVINKTNYAEDRIYTGVNSSNQLSYGLKISIVGGSSIEARKIELSGADITNSVVSAKPIILKDGDRIKAFKIPFSSNKTFGERFIIQFKMEWPNAMREDYDGIFFNEHNFFLKGVCEAIIKLHFRSGEIENVLPRIYNRKRNEITRDNFCTLTQVDSNNFIWEKSIFAPDETYVLMFKYKNFV